MIVEKKVNKDGTIDLSIRCEFCNEPITKTSVEFGMDCKNDCHKKEFEKLFRKMDDLHKKLD